MQSVTTPALSTAAVYGCPQKHRVQEEDDLAGVALCSLWPQREAFCWPVREC